MPIMEKLLNNFLRVLFVSFIAVSCSKSNTNPANPASDYTGTYVGNQGGLSITMQVFKGETSNQIKILYGGWSTPANLDGPDFTIVPTSFGPINISGSGTFSENKMTVNYKETGHTISATLIKQ